MCHGVYKIICACKGPAHLVRAAARMLTSDGVALIDVVGGGDRGRSSPPRFLPLRHHAPCNPPALSAPVSRQLCVLTRLIVLCIVQAVKAMQQYPEPSNALCEGGCAHADQGGLPPSQWRRSC